MGVCVILSYRQTAVKCDTGRSSHGRTNFSSVLVGSMLNSVNSTHTAILPTLSFPSFSQPVCCPICLLPTFAVCPDRIKICSHQSLCKTPKASPERTPKVFCQLAGQQELSNHWSVLLCVRPRHVADPCKKLPQDLKSCQNGRKPCFFLGNCPDRS